MKKKLPDKRKLQGAQTRQKLYEIAETLFAQSDFSAVSVEDITDAAGITKGAFYVHFQSKDELIAELIADYAARADTDYRGFLDSLPEGMSSSDVLLALCGKIAGVLSGSIGYENMRKVYQMLLAGTVETGPVKNYDRELYRMFHTILEEGIRKGEFKGAPPADTLSRHFVMAIRGICYEWCVRHPDFDLETQLAEHMGLLLEGIASRDTRVSR